MSTSEIENPASTRRYPMNKPDGFVPAVQRYSAVLPEDVSGLRVLYLGAQSDSGDMAACLSFLNEAQGLFRAEHGPVHFDFARFEDPQGYTTVIAIAYWKNPSAYQKWQASQPVRDWWTDPAKTRGALGYFWEGFATSVDHTETITFKEYVRGLSACPMSKVMAMGESGYWGAARDRLSATANDQLAPSVPTIQTTDANSNSRGQRISITPPQNFVIIRSGASWADCGDEQLQSYRKNIKPKLDAGMEYLRNNPVNTGCYSLRQVDVITIDGKPQKEDFCVGYFRSLEDLEIWAVDHPTHLAIYTRAMAERKKYGERLEFRTYHEVFVLDHDRDVFEYVNCHPHTGLLPFFRATP